MIIGAVGFIGSGKNAFAEILHEDYGYEFESFAKPLKDATAIIFGWPRELLEGDTEASRVFREQKDPWWSERLGRNITPRIILQEMGTEALRHGIHDDVWLASLEQRIGASGCNYVITDVRFPNELEAIRKMGGKIVQILRGEQPEWFYTAFLQNRGILGKNIMESRYPDIHVSEWAWIGSHIDKAIYNDGTLEEMREKVKQLTFL